MIKDGFRTSEFWLSVAAVGGATVLLGMHRITPAEWSTMTGISASVYTAGRSVLKSLFASKTVTVTPVTPSERIDPSV